MAPVAGAPGVGKVTTFDPETPAPEDRLDHLALWVKHHQEPDGALPLEQCVVDLASPELTGAQAGTSCSEPDR
ncbi:hypothetical protein [Streptomyces decoyicus]|uniref:hypothetical protein n=1 Tax=Streptomyces decoyicus TaxID=249567 RepID=UPI00386F2757|nr:hypothetical protein OG532_00440 [Streptomyces decoyicus]